MDAKIFVEHLTKNVLSDAKAALEKTILEGAHTELKNYMSAVGQNSIINQLIKELPVILKNLEESDNKSSLTDSVYQVN